jgi:predicted transcriptional regulator
MSNTDTKVLTAHVPVELSERVDVLADRLDRSRGWVVKQALAAWVTHEEEKTRMTEAAMAEVDQNALVSHSDMLAWAESLDTANPLPLPQ